MSALPAAVALAALSDGVRFVVCDLETTPSDDGERLISVGVVQVDGRGQQLAAPIEWLCNPRCKIENTRIHGHADVANEPPFTAHLDELAELLTPTLDRNQVVFVAHNAGYDLGVLQLEHDRAGRQLVDVAVLDTRELARYLKIPAGGFSLRQLLAYFGRKPTNAHNALADATDTAALLRHLLEQAARNGADELTTLLAAVQGKRRRSGDYVARSAKRNTRAMARSPFTFVGRPESHLATHKRLPANPSLAQLRKWLKGLHECVEIRCPLLMDRAHTVRSAHREILEDLLQELAGTFAFDESPEMTVTANALLGAISEIARSHLSTTEAVDFYDQVVDAVGSFVVRCGARATADAPYDACPECRAGHACPADTWHQGFAVAFTSRRINPARIGVWLGPRGRLAEHAAAGRTPLAAHAAWLLVEAADQKQPDNADAVAALAQELGLVEPRLLLRQARALAAAGELETAIETANTNLAARNGSSDPAWRDLHTYRDALTARQHVRQHVRPPRPRRAGRSAPNERPQRRRFTLGYERVPA